MTTPATAPAFAFRPGERAALDERLREHAELLRQLIIAIDGPAASGKSTTARAVAARLGLFHLDTGAMYRALTLLAERQGIGAGDEPALVRLAAAHTIALEPGAAAARVLVDGEDVSTAIRTPEVTAAVSEVASHPEVRRAMVRQQRALGAHGGVILDGRDIGTVVFPDASVKVFLVADVATRAARRQAEDAARGVRHDLAALSADLERRDRADSTRSASPLEQAPDAVRLDTSRLQPADQVDAVLALAVRQVRNERLAPSGTIAAGRVRVLEVDAEASAQPGYRPFHSFVYWFCHTAIRVLARLVFGLRIHFHPAARLRGSVLVAANHISGLDPPLVGSCVPFETWFLAKVELFKNPALGALIHRFNGIPIRRGTADFETLDRAVEELRKTHNVLMFPEGTRHKPGTLGDPRWGFGYVALAAGRPIVPLFVRGTRDGRPRGLRREPMEVWIGPPFRLEAVETADHAAYKEAARLAMDRIAAMMLRSAAARPLRGLELPGAWAGAPTERTESNAGPVTA